MYYLIGNSYRREGEEAEDHMTGWADVMNHLCRSILSTTELRNDYNSYRVRPYGDRSWWIRFDDSITLKVKRVIRS